MVITITPILQCQMLTSMFLFQIFVLAQENNLSLVNTRKTVSLTNKSFRLNYTKEGFPTTEIVDKNPFLRE